MERKLILVVDDERGLADTLAAMMQVAGWRSRVAYSAEEALDILRNEVEPALIISDVLMPGANGLELAVQVRRRWPKVRILLISGNAATQDLVSIARTNGFEFELLAKPVPPKQLLVKVASLLDSENMKSEHS